MRKFRASFVNVIISTVRDMIVKSVLDMVLATVGNAHASPVGQVISFYPLEFCCVAD